jgi:hypothetical protein
MRERTRTLPLYLVPLLVALLPIIGINVSYLIAASVGHVPWCNPYLDGCTSVSATGRYPPEAFVFRATAIPQAVLLMLFWPLAIGWLRQLGDTARGVHTAILVLGVTAGVFLIVYATVLGEVGQHYRLQRQLGATVFFSFNFLAQLILTQRVIALGRNEHAGLAVKYTRGLLAPCIAMFALGLLSVIWQLFWGDYDRVEDAIEWVFAILVALWFVPAFLAWKGTGFSARLRATADDP